MTTEGKIEQWDSEQAMLADLEARGFSPSRYVYPPGTFFPPHTHAVDKIAAVVSGRFRLTLHGQSITLGPLQGIFVPRNALHDAEVVGSESVVSVDAIRE